MEKKLLAAAAILIVIAGILYFLFLPNQTDDWYVEYEGDEYLKGEIIPEDVPIYDEPDPDDIIEYGTTLTIDECLGIDDLAGDNFVSRDYCLFMVGSGKNSPDACEEISNQEEKDMCYTEIAYNLGDATYCENVVSSRSECVVDVALRKNDSALCGQASFEYDNCIKAIESDNNSFCKNCGRFMGFCFDAVDNDKPEECDKVYDWSEFCYIEIALETDNSSLCPMTEDSDYCYYEIARQTADHSLCEKLSQFRDQCVAWIAFDTGNIALCEQAGDEKDLCIEDILYEE